METDWLITGVGAALVVARRLQDDRRKILQECDELRDELRTLAAECSAGAEPRPLTLDFEIAS
jgi:hypothetical protein